MAKALTIEINGVKEMARAFAKAPEIVKLEINPAIKKSIFTLEGRSVPHMPTDTGFLRNSNATKFSSFKGVLENRAPYAMAVHEGTAPHFPPIREGEGISLWARRKGIPVFLVARAIARKGTKAVPFYQISVDESQKDIQRNFDKALDNITNRLAK